ncbi:class I SAM-dependent methyltransferase [Nonomuraea sp. NPDC049784]|uniref:SAM-dependent methyltransferase n=1 Tax=Nonomuraea sp. NPDC049784 TaxID=3154361 RepID=UPI0033C6BF64
MAGVVGLTALAHTRLKPGERVLDIGCGCGATTLQAAAYVALGGTVTGIDISAAMLRVAGDRQAAAGTGNVSFVHADVQTHAVPGPFDAAISRFGTCSSPTPSRRSARSGQDCAPVAAWSWRPGSRWPPTSG